MTYWIWISMSVVLIVLSIAMKPLRVWLERCAKHAENQGTLVEEYYRSATRFIQNTDPVRNLEARRMIAGFGYLMMSGTKLIKMMILSHRRIAERGARPVSDDNPLANLSEDNVHAFSRAMGAALLVSSYHSVFFGARYRSMLMLLLEGDNKEVKDPQQLVFRFQRANSRRRAGFNQVTN